MTAIVKNPGNWTKLSESSYAIDCGMKFRMQVGMGIKGCSPQIDSRASLRYSPGKRGRAHIEVLRAKET
ncbi:MAG: hypothetical protein OXI37_06090 [Gammaproteobacteria bacterium]|nr:hypothetical protein [Gammaproteobacteria bacterium]